MNVERLLELADVLDAAHERGTNYDQKMFFHDLYSGHPCGTPACALGHWAYANQDRWENCYNTPTLKHRRNVSIFDAVHEEFGLNSTQASELFGGYGCGFAKDAKQAAAYIRDFVFRNNQCPAE